MLLSLVVNTSALSAVDCVQRLVSKMSYHIMCKIFNVKTLLTDRLCAHHPFGYIPKQVQTISLMKFAVQNLLQAVSPS